MSLETFLGLLIIIGFGILVYSNWQRKSFGEVLADMISFFKELGGKK